ncbi:MAG: glycosyltransferase [Candidatus Binatia bacterium]
MAYKNRERLKEYNFSLSPENKQPGTSALLRIKNEEDKIFYCLASILDVFDEIVFINNGSLDRTAAIVREFQEQFDPTGKIKAYVYPFRIARLGPEHFNTPADSVHSIVYYYNWGLSLCTRTWVFKWDGDMVLNAAAKPSFLRHMRDVQAEPESCWWLCGQTVYRDPAGAFYLATDEMPGEIRFFPNGGNPRFHKRDLHEVLRRRPRLKMIQTENEPLFYELKFTDVDEFSHWGLAEIPTPRKQREQRNFKLVKSGQADEGPFQKLPATFLDDQISAGPAGLRPSS